MGREKKFDAVKMMREIRDKLSKEFMNMSYEEQERYIKEKIKPEGKATQKAEMNTYKM
ncbi:MAG: hypothetical protein ACUZ77_12975 [Candidatus Brocadiales bacterium]